MTMGDAQTRPCVLCNKPFVRRSVWRPKRYCKRWHQLGHYIALIVGGLLS
ncbi:hypothetical protein [Streptomyces sp. NPDC048361]